jgi:alpha-N-arabinofuranosidase
MGSGQESRPARPNLIWGGVEDNWFGTAEFIQYCGPFQPNHFWWSTWQPERPTRLLIGLSIQRDGEYLLCQFRRAHGFPEPFNVKYWGLGNEEYAETDVGRTRIRRNMPKTFGCMPK